MPFQPATGPHNGPAPQQQQQQPTPTPRPGPDRQADLRTSTYDQGRQQVSPQGHTGSAAPTWQAIQGGAILERGHQGPSVTELQKRLTSLGFGVALSGEFGPQTEELLKAFQATYGVQQTGRFGPTTQGALIRAQACSVTVDQLVAITGLDPEAARRELRHLNPALYAANISTVARKAAFLAQLAHESMGLKQFEEFASGAAYEGRRDLGNNRPGDGKRYKGRGAIQLTGRANYRAATRDLGGMLNGANLEADPERAEDPEVRYLTAAWYWNTRGLNEHADAGKFDTITRRINGGLNGKADRDQYHRKALKVLGG